MKVQLNKDVWWDDPRNYSNCNLFVGQILTVFRGPTHGCVSSHGQAFTFSDDPWTGPFFELPREYVNVIGEDAF